ncbi:uncharacterized protein cenpu [Leuresthes tenuis]|uniref:uncharacterized protein cenpu n=1 Tax=Leuresthes tenuis TaxID=355514 RepID=UPI003B50D848
MSTRKGRGAKVLREAPRECQKGSSFDQMDSPNVSAIDKASFMEDLQLNHSDPLHSTAMEEELNVFEDGQMDKGTAGRGNVPNTLKTAGKHRGAALKRKGKEVVRKRSTLEQAKTSFVLSRADKRMSEKQADEEVEKERLVRRAVPQRSRHPAPTANRRVVGKKPAGRRSAGQMSAAKPVKSQQVEKVMRTESESDIGKTTDGQSEEESDSGTVQRRRSRVLSSDEDVDEDTSWNPSPKRSKMPSFGRTQKSSSDRFKSRKSSSGSASGEAKKASADKRSRKRYGGRGATELEVVLDALLDFSDQYRESVESTALKQAIDCFSNNVKDQLLEKISLYKDLRVLKRENAKVASLIRTKTQRLLNAKHELMSAERQGWLLQKEKVELQNRLSDLRRGQAFLRDIRGLSSQYLDHRRKNPTEKETYGAPSLPALLLETKLQPRGVNNRPEKRQEKGDTRITSCAIFTQTYTLCYEQL